MENQSEIFDSGGYPGPEIDVDRFTVRLRRVLGGKHNFPFDANYQYHVGVLLKDLRLIKWKLGA